MKKITYTILDINNCIIKTVIAVDRYPNVFDTYLHEPIQLPLYIAEIGVIIEKIYDESYEDEQFDSVFD